MTGVVLDQAGPWSLVTLVVLLVLFGGLIPRWMHNQRIREKDRLIDRLTAALDHRDEQFDILIRQGETTVRLLEDIKRASAERSESRHQA